MEKASKVTLKKGIMVIYGVIGFFFAFFVKAEYDLSKTGNIAWTGSYWALLLLVCACGAFGAIMLYFTVKELVNLARSKPVKLQRKKLDSRIAFFGSLGLNILAYLPFYLAFFPGICAYDLSVQLGQIYENAYNDHHPLFHTLLIKECIELGGGIAMCTALQLILLAIAFAFIIYTLNKCGVSLAWQIIVQAYFMFNLFHGYIAVSITKDTVFTAFFIIFICSFFLLRNCQRTGYSITLIIGAIGACLFRNNGKYALFVALFAMLVAIFADKKNRKFWRNTFFKTAGAFIFATVLLKTVFIATDAAHGDKREMLSVPLQQIARVAVYEKDKLTDEEKSLIDELILYNAYEDYNPVIADPVKKCTNTSVVRYETGRFIKIYFELFKKYPSDYINATLALIGGYVSPFDETFRIMNVDGVTVTRNYIQHSFTAYGYESLAGEHSLWPSLKTALDNWAEGDGFMNPLIRVFYIPGIYLWIYLIIFAVIMERKHYGNLIPLMLVLGFFGTLLLGPTMHLRYIYPVMVVLPIFLCGKHYET